MNLAIATFKNCRDNQPRQRETTWEELSVVLMRHAEREEKDGPLWSPTLYKPGTTRAKANVEEVTCLVLDFDSGAGPGEFGRRLRGFTAAMHTTFQHLPEAQRWRVVLPLLKPVPAIEWPHVWEQMTRHFGGGGVDASCKDASRIYYTPSCPPGAERDAMAQEGEWLDPAGFARPTVPLLVTRAMSHLGEGRNNAGMWLACQLRDNGYTQTEAERADWHRYVTREKSRPDGRIDVYDADEWLLNVQKAYSRSARDPWKPSKNGNHATEDPSFVFFQPPNAPEEDAAEGPGPPRELAPEALHGLPGEIVRAISPHTESHPAAILVSFLAATGCLIGPQPFVYRDAGRQTCAEYYALVGPTGMGRKGTAERRVSESLEYLYDSNYTALTTCHMRDLDYPSLVISGLGSGEALIETLADPDEDRRRIVFESEFSKALKVMRREGSILSEILRDGWDGRTLENRTKGKKLIAKGAHLCLVGHITQHELLKQIENTEAFNGFSNRILWIWTQRQQFLPLGGGRPNVAALISELHSTLTYARTAIHQVEFDDEVQSLWCPKGGLYEQLGDRPENLFGAVTSRADAHVTRLALEYAVLDAEKVIRLPHLLGALALWDYAEQTCFYLFGDLTGDEMADRIEELLRVTYPGFVTRKEIWDAVNRNAKVGRIDAALYMLRRQGRAQSAKVESAGRYPEVWTWIPRALGARKKTKEGSFSPFQWAKQQIEGREVASE